MKEVFGNYTNKIRDYCKENGLDYEKLEKMQPMWGMDFLSIHAEDGADVLQISGYSPAVINIEPTKNTDRYLK